MSELTRKMKLAFLRAYAGAQRGKVKSASGPGVIVVPPASPGGLGDDALVNSLAWALGEKGHSEILCATFADTDNWRLPRTRCRNIPVPRKRVRAWLNFLRQIHGCQSLMVIGADMIDGHYGAGPSLLLLQSADLAARMGLSATVVGASFNGEAPGSVNRFIQSMSPEVHLFARDPVSKQRLDVLRSQPTPLVADIAFLLPPATPEDSTLVRGAVEWIADQRRRGTKLIVGCNTNLAPVARLGRPTELLMQSYIKAFEALHERHGPLGVVFISHDRREPFNDQVTLASLSKMLPPGIQRYAGLLEGDGRAAEMKAAAGQCDMLVSGRMHLVIGSLGSGTPAGVIGYQGKCEGLFQHFGLSGMVMEATNAIDAAQMTDWLCGIADRRQVLKEQIARALPRVRELAQMNMDYVAAVAKPAVAAREMVAA